ncbi:hypothetical protein MLD38_003613 [Melastoma candidum]|uniref:Uncharacterized protein n=1 Tax=Melastoma candidum TaxID=119954 RepID=A0ACB9S4H7_9MYRT|nr:hypothetical protein MLD38_003613 [Melastoma candidum]
MTAFFISLLFLLSGTAAHVINPNHHPKCLVPNRVSTSTIPLFHVHSPCSAFRPPDSLSWEHTVLELQAQDNLRLEQLTRTRPTAKKSVVPLAPGRQIIQSPTYIARVQIGTPAQVMLMAIDTSNDMAWVPCLACVGCSSPVVFDNSKSSTFASLGCQAAQCQQAPTSTCSGSSCIFNMTYGGSSLAASLSQDVLTVATDAITGYTFGCIQKATGTSLPPQGLLGLGRGSLSLPSQSQNLYQSTFSYCLPSPKSTNFSGSLRLGPVGQPKRIKSTPLLKNPVRPSLYYVNLLGIRVGSKVVNIPASALAFNTTNGGGTIFDSGTVYTRLVAPAYAAVRDEFRRRMRNANVTSLGGFDTCYTVPIAAPTMTLIFEGMNVTLPAENLLIHSTAGSITCLAMAGAPDNVNSVVNVIASMQQQNHRVLIDVPNSRLGVARETCS